MTCRHARRLITPAVLSLSPIHTGIKVEFDVMSNSTKLFEFDAAIGVEVKLTWHEI